jgi:hypothetical protein
MDTLHFFSRSEYFSSFSCSFTFIAKQLLPKDLYTKLHCLSVLSHRAAPLNCLTTLPH